MLLVVMENNRTVLRRKKGNARVFKFHCKSFCLVRLEANIFYKILANDLQVKEIVKVCIQVVFYDCRSVNSRELSLSLKLVFSA